MNELIDYKDGIASIRLNPKIYDLDVLYSASYVFLDKAYLVLDGDPDKEYIVKIKNKNGGSAEIIAMEFLNELINYGDYKRRAEGTKKIREALLQRALFTNDPESAIESDPELEAFLKELEEEDKAYTDNNSEGIAAPWEEKHSPDHESKKA